MEQCYVYKWTHQPSLKWYVGSRTARGCHPFDGYICSSRWVKPLIQNNPTEWIREIIATGSAQEMRELEKEILVLFAAHRDPRSFNLTNTAGKICSMEPWNRGKKGLQTSWNKGLFGEQSHRYGKSNKRNWRPADEHNLQTKERMLGNNPNLIKVMCPVCGKEGAKPAMKRFHFDNCGKTTTVSDESKKKRSESAKQRWAKSRQGE